MAFPRLIHASYMTPWVPRIEYTAKNRDSRGIFLLVTAKLNKNRPFYALFEPKSPTLIDIHTVQTHLAS